MAHWKSVLGTSRVELYYALSVIVDAVQVLVSYKSLQDCGSKFFVPLKSLATHMFLVV